SRTKVRSCGMNIVVENQPSARYKRKPDVRTRGSANVRGSIRIHTRGTEYCVAGLWTGPCRQTSRMIMMLPVVPGKQKEGNGDGRQEDGPASGERQVMKGTEEMRNGK